MADRRRVEILLPVADSDGRRFPEAFYRDLRKRLVDRFGGATVFSQAPAEGFWQDGGGVERDDIVVFQAVVENLDRDWWAALKRELEAQFRQDEIAIWALPVERL